MNATSNGDAPNKKRVTLTPVTAAEALQLLESAVNYCQQAGLAIRAGNVPNLCLSIDGAIMEGDPPRFVLTDSSTDVAIPQVRTPTTEATATTRPVRSRL